MGLESRLPDSRTHTLSHYCALPTGGHHGKVNLGLNESGWGESCTIRAAERRGGGGRAQDWTSGFLVIAECSCTTPVWNDGQKAWWEKQHGLSKFQRRQTQTDNVIQFLLSLFSPHTSVIQKMDGLIDSFTFLYVILYFCSLQLFHRDDFKKVLI